MDISDYKGKPKSFSSHCLLTKTKKTKQLLKPNKFAVDVKERQDRLPTMYWLPKLHKRPYKARFFANSSSCTTKEISKLLTSCLTAIKAKVIKYCETVYERSGKNMFWPIKKFW